jgi:hypothetical protein
MGGNAQYYRKLRSERSFSRRLKAAELTSADSLIKSRPMMRQIVSWIELGRQDYAWRSIKDLGLRKEDVWKVLDAAIKISKERELTNKRPALDQ